MPTVLMIAFHFPPLRGSSGIQRTLRFCQYLPEFGWSPSVLSAHPRAYETVGEDLLGEVPPAMPVARAWAWDAARHFAFRGAYPRFLANPDRWVSWLFAGVARGVRLVRRERPQAIFSTYPIATAHLIGLVLYRITGLPWVADFRDPMAQDGYPADPAVWRRFRWIEERVLRRAARALFTSPGAITEYRHRYPDLPADRFVLLENGYDEEAFAGLERGAAPKRARLLVLHSGIVYTAERDPTMLFEALGSLKRSGAISGSTLEVRFRASANDELLHRLARAHDVADIVTCAPAIPYRAALEEMLGAGALLVLQAANCNSQIPAKTYEYLRARRPILALTDAGGDTADLLRRAGLAPLAPLDDAAAIAAAVPRFLDAVRAGNAAVADSGFVLRASRRERARELAGVLASLPPRRR